MRFSAPLPTRIGCELTVIASVRVMKHGYSFGPRNSDARKPSSSEVSVLRPGLSHGPTATNGGGREPPEAAANLAISFEDERAASYTPWALFPRGAIEVTIACSRFRHRSHLAAKPR